MPEIGTQQAAAIEETGLATRQEFSQELAPTANAEAARQEIQAAVILAKRFPRNEDEAYAKIIKACKRPAFAGDAEYAFPRGGKQITGPSIYLAREFARAWGNIRHGCDVVSDSETERTIRAWAWDLETNTKVSADATFKKLIQRKGRDGTVWVTPDERDLRELTNKHAALAKRNCLLELLPSDMVEDACNQSQKTLKNRAAEDPDALRKALISSFDELHVPIAKLETYLGHPIGESSPDELVMLRTIYKSIKDGNSTWAEYMKATNGTVDAEELKNKTEEKAKDLAKKLGKDQPEEPVAETKAEDQVIDGEIVEEAPTIDKAESSLEDLLVVVKEKLDELGGEKAKVLLNGRKPGGMDIKQLNGLLSEIEKAEASK